MAAAWVRDVREDAFESEVVEASHKRPVVVDFWAPWCGPCHQLSPLLERVAERYAGDVEVVKVNVDEAQGLARRYRVQGIPAVKAFRQGAVVAEFTGVQPEAAVERFFDALAPSEADRLFAAAREADDAAMEERLLLEALEHDPGHAGATVGLAGLLVDRGDPAGAGALLERVPADPAARRLLARIALDAAADEPLEVLQAAAERGDPEARLRLGRALAARGQAQEALEALLSAVRHPLTREEARKAVLEVFEVLGAGSELVARYRPKLASALY
jgi:putative thioredoxin